MTSDDTPHRPARPAPDSREARLKAALRANLGRRKAQARGRVDQGGADQDGAEQPGADQDETGPDGDTGRAGDNETGQNGE